MDYAEINRLMVAKGLDTDPAFGDALRIAIEPTPNFNGCPLGLYYPDEITIVLPPDAADGALFHELGHRHGHYYYNDLSELHAEDFRRKYQRGAALLYMGNHFNRLPKFGVLFEEGERGAVEIALNQPLTTNELHQIKSQLNSHGETPPSICCGYNGIPFIRFEFTKGVDWIMIIGSTLAAMTIAGVGAIGYAIYKTAKVTPWVVPVALAGIGAALLLRAAIKQEKVRGRLLI